MDAEKKLLEAGSAILGIELGSTRIKAVVVDDAHRVIATGGYNWENRLEDGIWTYSLQDVERGLQEAYADLTKQIRDTYDVTVTRFSAIGVSGMMHGYLPFDKEMRQLAAFRTWRNTTAREAAEQLTSVFQYNIPDRWCVAHLYDMILREEAHVREIDFLTTLAGYIHFRLTGERVLGIGDASGMMAVDTARCDYDEARITQFEELIADRHYPWTLRGILPRVLKAGDPAGELTKEGAAWLDVSGSLESGIPLCPPEGDTATGMVATNAVARGTGNLSAGTSGFLMLVMEEQIKSLHRELEPIATPDSYPVAMVHANNCTTDINAWVSLFKEFAELCGRTLSTDELYGTLYRKALEGEADAGGSYAFNYHAGEGIAHLDEGRPMFVRMPQATFDLASFMRAQLYGTMTLIRMGVDLLRAEGGTLSMIVGHGGLFKTEGVAQKFLADALKTPVAVMQTAGEGGAFGIAVLASYMVNRAQDEALPVFLNERVYVDAAMKVMEPDEEGMDGFDRYLEGYKRALNAERAAVEAMR